MSDTKDNPVSLLGYMVTETMAAVAHYYPSRPYQDHRVFDADYYAKIIEARLDTVSMRGIRNACALYADWPIE
jgi:hypothetical protein